MSPSKASPWPLGKGSGKALPKPGVGASGLTLENLVFDALDIRSVVVFADVSNFTLKDSVVRGHYHEALCVAG